jgi:hypothetical protein
MNMDKDQEKIASENHGDAAACGPSPGPGCWPLPSEWDRFIPPSAINIVSERVREEIGGGTSTRPVWNQEWLRGLEAFIRSIAQDEIRKANPKLTVPPLSADTVGRVVGTPNQKGQI